MEQSMTSLINTTSPMRRWRSREQGVALVVLLYGMSVFSVLSLTALRNVELERTLHNADNPDLHVVLYTGGAGAQTMVGRLNLPTLWRELEGPDKSTEVRIPGAPNLNLASELAPGSAYAVRLSPHVRVCCDGGDNACANVTWDDEIAAGSVTPPVSRPLDAAGASRQLQFALLSLAVPSDVALDPTATASSAFLVRATRLREGSSVGTTGPSQDAQRMTCTLQSGDATLATGTLRIQPGLDENRLVTRISSGTLELKYGGTDDVR
jgi:hypothetical protein